MWLALLMLVAPAVAVRAADTVQSGPLVCRFDGAGMPVRIRSAGRLWLDEPVRVNVRNEVTNVSGGAKSESRWSAGRPEAA